MVNLEQLFSGWYTVIIITVSVGTYVGMSLYLYFFIQQSLTSDT